MRCQGFQNQLSGYLEGELDRYHREAVERHLQVCAACRSDLRSLTRTVSLIREIPAKSPSPSVQNALAQKIRAVRQPMGFMERLRLQWRVGGLAAQTRTWGVGMAATLLLIGVASGTRDTWETEAEKLFVGVGIYDTHTPAVGSSTAIRPRQPMQRGSDLPVANAPGAGVHIEALAATPMIAGQQARVLLSIEPQQDLRQADVVLYTAAGVSVLGDVAQLSDASYLLRHGDIVTRDPRSRFVWIEVCPTIEGVHTLRAVVRQGSNVLAQAEVPLHVAPASR